jgi:AcrR family transcriptional regulator
MFKTRKSQETYHRVRDAAISLFVRQGFEATTMREIAQEGRLGLGALYYYFRSKEDIILAFYQEQNQAVARRFQHERDTSAPWHEQLLLLLRWKLEQLAPYRDFLRVVLQVALDPRSPVNPLHPESAETLDLSLGLIRQLLEGAGLPRPAELARALWLAHIGVLVYWLHDRSPSQAATRKALGLLGGLLELLPALPAELQEQALGLSEALFV